jgi:hypothetical protein
MFKIMDFTVSVRYSGKDGNIFIIVQQVLFPYLNSLVVLVEGLIAVSQSKKGIVISRIMIQTAFVENSRLTARSALADSVTHTNQGVIVIFIKLKNMGEAVNSFTDFIFLEQPVTVF